MVGIMKLYKIEYQALSWGASEQRIKWCGSQKDVADFKREIKQSPELSLVSIDNVDIPTDKTGLLFWLNDNLHTDNG